MTAELESILASTVRAMYLPVRELRSVKGSSPRRATRWLAAARGTMNLKVYSLGQVIEPSRISCSRSRSGDCRGCVSIRSFTMPEGQAERNPFAASTVTAIPRSPASVESPRTFLSLRPGAPGLLDGLEGLAIALLHAHVLLHGERFAD